MELKLTKDDQIMLGINDVQRNSITLVAKMSATDLRSCRDANNIIIEVFQIITEKMGKAQALLKTKDLQISETKAKTLTRLSQAKIMSPTLAVWREENRQAREAYGKSEQKEPFIPLHSDDEFKEFDVRDVTKVPPEKLTDTGMKAIADSYAYNIYKKDYEQLSEICEILRNVKDNIINIGKRIDGVVMAFGIEHKMSGGNSETER